jgi:hypothetical protein
MMPRTVSPEMVERNAEIARLYTEEGLDISEIAGRYGLTKQRVWQVLAPLEPEVHRGRRKREERHAVLREAHARIVAGESNTAAEAERIGITREHLRDEFHSLGLYIRNKSVPKHGTFGRYDDHGCRCWRCRRAAREHRHANYERGPSEHGTASAYKNYGCRCPLCSEANRLHERARKADKRRAKEPTE